LRFYLDPHTCDSDLTLVAEPSENKPPKVTARERMITEAIALFVFGWIVAIGVALFRPPPPAAYASFGPFRIIIASLANGFEMFVFGYLLSRFFKQFKTGCAFAIILFLGYLLWAGRHPY
jgi:hypothetical protein